MLPGPQLYGMALEERTLLATTLAAVAKVEGVRFVPFFPL